jgi:hypothetical protein
MPGHLASFYLDGDPLSVCGRGDQDEVLLSCQTGYEQIERSHVPGLAGLDLDVHL